MADQDEERRNKEDQVAHEIDMIRSVENTKTGFIDTAAIAIFETAAARDTMASVKDCFDSAERLWDERERRVATRKVTIKAQVEAIFKKYGLGHATPKEGSLIN